MNIVRNSISICYSEHSEETKSAKLVLYASAHILESLHFVQNDKILVKSYFEVTFINGKIN